MVADVLHDENTLQLTVGGAVDNGAEIPEQQERVSDESGHTNLEALTYSPRQDQGTGSESIISGPWPSAAVQTAGSTGADAQRIARSPFAKAIVRELSWLRNNQIPGSAEVSPRVHRLFSLIQDYVERRFSDPFSSYLNAVFDGLCSDNRWADLDPAQYGRIEEITRKLAGQKLFDYRSVDKAIAQLEALGVDTTPYGFED